MTLTLPTPDAGGTAQQRFALKLLLQQPVSGPEQLLASRNLRDDALPETARINGGHCRPSARKPVRWT